MNHNSELIEIKNDTKAQTELESADKISQIVSAGMIGLGIVALADAFFDYSSEVSTLASGYLGTVCVLGGTALYAINHRFNSGNANETNQN